MSRPTDKPMARAHAHFAAGRFAEAAGAFRAVLGIDPSAVPARLGLADALMARGRRSAAVDGLVEAAEACAELEQHAQALLLYAKALSLDPRRIELHLDVAAIEQAMGRRDAAIARVEGLAERYMGTGRTDEAAELLRFAASWEQGSQSEEIIEELEADEAHTVVARNPLLRERAAKPAWQAPRTETVVCATVLIRPDGSLWAGPHAGVPEIDEAELTVARAVSAPIVLDEIEEVDPDMVTRVASMARLVAAKPTPSRPATSSTYVAARPKSIATKPAPATPTAIQPAVTKPIVTTKPIAAKPSPARPSSAKPIATKPSPAKPIAAKPSPARPIAAKPSPAKPISARPAAAITPASTKPTVARATPAKPIAARPAEATPTALVERLRRRAGLGPEAAVAVPHATMARGTEPIVIRRLELGRPERDRDEEVTLRFRQPRGSLRAAAC
jgi:hypothetical protein